MAADLTAPAPVEPAKAGDYLHDQGRLPAPPPSRTPEKLRTWGGFILGFAVTMGLTALAFETRATWDEVRDWVVPAAIPLLAIAGIALGHLTNRQKWAWALLGWGLLLVVLGLTVSNLWRGAYVDGDDLARDVLAVLTGIVMGVFVVYMFVALAWVELKEPQRPPAPEEA